MGGFLLRTFVNALGLLVIGALVARGPGAQEVDPRFMSRTEVQMVQDALIWNGSFDALKDGLWGPMTTEAVRRWREAAGLRQSPTFNIAELTQLFATAIRARSEVDWTMWRDPHTGGWFGFPAALVRPNRRDEPVPGFMFATEFESRRIGISFTALRVAGPVTAVRELLSQTVHNSHVTYRLDRDHRQVISMLRRDGATQYARLDRVGGEWRGFLVAFADGFPDMRRLIVAISAEFSATGHSVIEAPYDAPILGPIVGRLMRPTSPPPPTVAGGQVPPPPGEPRITGSGTAFVVAREGTLLTNHHVVAGCRRVSLPDGTEVAVVQSDVRRDLAVLRVARTYSNIVQFRRDQTVDLGESVSLFGFPHYGTVSTSLNLTNGIITSLVGTGNDPLHFQLNAAMQPGNSGGPVLDEAGFLIGVAVARLRDDVTVRETGTIPQTMNYAIRGQVVEAFLLENGIRVEKRASHERADLREVAQRMENAVLPILCWRQS